MAKKTKRKVPRSHLIIGVGASAGGLEALSLFVANLPPHFAASIIIAQRLAPHAKSMMVELLSKQSVLPVTQATDGCEIEAGTIMIVPPNYDIDIENDRVKLMVAEVAIGPKLSVDEFFTSLAKNYGNRAVGIILSGTGSDGSRGIRAIKAAGGITLAQDDRSAKYDGMPKSAVDTGSVDTILPPEQLASGLLQILFEHEAASNRARTLRDLVANRDRRSSELTQNFF